MRWLVLVGVLLGAGCAKELADLEPIACPKNGQCLDGLACVDGTCQKPRVDSRCEAFSLDGGVDNVNCGLVNAQCWHGYCEQGCNTYVPDLDAGVKACPTGRLCADYQCLPDCTDGTPCPTGLVCRQVGAGPAHACLLPQQYLPACQSYTVTSADSCYTCGAANFQVPCPNNQFCVNGSTCQASNTCSCTGDFVELTCAGVACGGATVCNYPNWYCKPKTITSGTCATTQYGSGTCACSDGRSVARTCTTETCEQLCTVIQ